MRVGFRRPVPAILLSALLLGACASPTPSWLASGSAATGPAATSVASPSAAPTPVLASASPLASVPPSGSPAPSPAAADRWVRVDSIEQPTRLTSLAPLDSAGNPVNGCGTCHPPIATVLVDAASGHGGVVAVGYELPSFAGAVWWSADGNTWTIDTPAFTGISMLASVAADDNGYLAVGRSGDGAGAWRSSDGRSWTQAPSAGGIATPHLRLLSVTNWKGGFVAAGYVGAEFGEADAAFLTSPDGRTWTLAPTSPATRSARAVSVTATGAELVAVGSTGPGSTGPAAIWTSADGIAWTRVADSPALSDLRLRAVAPDSAVRGAVAVGENTAGSIGAVLRSSDGVTWERLPADPALGREGIQVRMYDVTTTGRGLVVVGVVTEGIQYGVAAIWRLSGTTWTLEPASEMLSDGEINALVPLGTHLFGVGDRGAPDAYIATVWRSPDGWAP